MSSKYPQGYIPKIEYWQYEVNKAIGEGDWGQVDYCLTKLSHFVSRQYVKENQVTMTQVMGEGKSGYQKVIGWN
jgi:hypothetical protein